MRSETRRVLLHERPELCARSSAAPASAQRRAPPIPDPTPSRVPSGYAAVAREHPTVAIELAPAADRIPPACLHVDAEVWAEAWAAEPSAGWRFDRALDRAVPLAVPLAVLVEGPAAQLPAVASQVLTRAQRRLRRRNHASATPAFDRLLAVHRALHEIDADPHGEARPLVLADYDHALDVWQWLLRLAPSAPLEVQLAALFHDIERLRSEAERRIEHLAADYLAFKDRHAAAGAEWTAALLRAYGVAEAVVCRTARLVAAHERQPGHAAARLAGHRQGRCEGPDELELLAVLNDADALSFFSLNSAGFVDYFGLAHSRVKIRTSLARLRPPARRYLARLRLRADVRALLDELAAVEPTLRLASVGTGKEARAR